MKRLADDKRFRKLFIDDKITAHKFVIVQFNFNLFRMVKIKFLISCDISCDQNMCAHR